MREPKNEITKMVDEGNMNLACELEGKTVRHCLNGEWDEAISAYERMIEYYAAAGYPVDERTKREVLGGMRAHDAMTVSEEIQEFVKWVEQGCKPVIKK